MLSIVNHWYELKLRFLYLIFSFILTFVVSYFYSDILMYFYVLPFISKFEQKRFIYTNLSEVFSSCLLVSLNITVVITVLLSLYSIFCFLKPGLYKKEFYIFKTSLKLLISSILISISFVYLIIFPGVIKFFIHFENFNFFDLSLEAKILDYLELAFSCLFWISFIFQVPIVVFLLIYFNLITINFFISWRKECILICFIFGALFSPPDVLTQLLIACPLWIFLESVILFFLVIDEYNS